MARSSVQSAVVGRVNKPVTVRLSDVVPERVDWLWFGRLPLGKLVVLDGDPSVGKSTSAVDFAARVSTGSAWPDGAPNRQGGVLLLSAEDGLADTIRPRLDAAGGDPTRVHAMTAVTETTGEWPEQRQGQHRAISLADTGAIEAAVKANKVVLVVVDVLMAFLPAGIDSHRDQDVRTVLSQLAAMAERTHCCVLLLRHLNKSSGGSPLYRGGGSIGIVGAARVGLLAAVDPEDDTRRVLAATKSNLAAMPTALSYQLVDSPDHGCARIEWLGDSGHSAGALLVNHSSEHDAEEGDELVGMLRTILDDANGEVPAGDGMKRLRAMGASPSKDTLFRARKRAGIESHKSTYGGGWVWSYTYQGSGQDPQGSEDSGSQKPRPFRTLAEPSGNVVPLRPDTLGPDGPEVGSCGHPANEMTTTGKCPQCILANIAAGQVGQPLAPLNLPGRHP